MMMMMMLPIGKVCQLISSKVIVAGGVVWSSARHQRRRFDEIIDVDRCSFIDGQMNEQAEFEFN